MPVYEYKCSVCGTKHELLQRHDAPPLTVCPDCGGHMKKLISSSSFVLKGTGWYKTDYASGGKSKEERFEKDSGKKQEKKSETKPDSKPETKVAAASKPE
jgi:putative FmdB family regulatory protein